MDIQWVVQKKSSRAYIRREYESCSFFFFLGLAYIGLVLDYNAYFNLVKILVP